MNQPLSIELQPNDRGFSLFQRALQDGKIYRFFARLFKKTDHLLVLEDALINSASRSGSYAGTHPVPVKLIQGTEGKGDEFDGQFHPMRESSKYRWLGILKERLRGHDLPPIDLVELNGIYYVRDGHHRVSVARSLGQNFVDAEVTRISLSSRMH